MVGLLRHEYGFAGAVVTDAIEMRGAAGVAGGVGPAAVAVRAFVTTYGASHANGRAAAELLGLTAGHT